LCFGAGGVLRILAIRVDLIDRCHGYLFFRTEPIGGRAAKQFGRR
jgi:hypothetical protein